MEKLEIEVHLINDGVNDELVFQLNPSLKIDLNSEDQSQLRNVFYEIIKLLFSSDVEFVFKDVNSGKPLYIEISQQYIKHLNEEVTKIRENLPIL